MKKYLLLLLLLATPPSFADTFVAKYDLADSMKNFESDRTFSLMRSGHGYTHKLSNDSGLECRITIGLKDIYNYLPEAEELVFIYDKDVYYHQSNYKSDFYKNSSAYGYIISTMRLDLGPGASKKLINVHPSFVSNSPHVIKCWSQNEFDYEDVTTLISDFFTVKRDWPSMKEIIDAVAEYISN